MKIRKSLIFASIIIVMLVPITAKAQKGDFYYGDSTNMVKISKANVKDSKDLLKQNIDNLYFQTSNDVIVKYKDFISELMSYWSNGNSLAEAYKTSIDDVNVQASNEIKAKAADVDADDPITDEKYDISNIY
ncbi:hypothetical protein [Clostridium scatologenes]|uniref:Uncharacterized protein n=1 Tax=Clostridium scatologenes TaxID=1548 RepID=A0A0E3MAN1_CLOSL|nr:hypothetical protein [Clostridium scatologenes]AKA70882.1 hypothetical protein CSCA_3757 [Clostridium scatologenes]